MRVYDRTQFVGAATAKRAQKAPAGEHQGLLLCDLERCKAAQ
jgi:hypothetical protein